MTLPTDLPARLRKHGLKVVEIDGWKTRGRPASTGGFAPVGCLCHDTVTSKATSDQSVIKLLVNGRSDLPGPLAQFGLARDGTVYVIAAGRCNHAGVAKPSGTVAGGDGNTLYIGTEAFNAGTGEPWPKAQYDAYVLLEAALCVEVTGNSAQTVRGHKETSVTGKIDPFGPTPYESSFDMDAFRSRVAKAIKTMKAPPPPPKPTPAFSVSIMSGRSIGVKDAPVAVAWQGERDAGQSLLLGTEVAGRDDKVLIGSDKRYGLFHATDGTKGENAVEYAKADWDEGHSHLVEVWPGGGKGRFAHKAYCRVSVLHYKHADHALVGIQNHEPAHLFATSKFFQPGNLARWMKVRNREAAIMRQLRKSHPGAAFMLSGDPNANGTFLARYMATHFAGFNAANGFKFGAAWVSGLRRVGTVTSQKTPSSDHPIQRLRLGWK